jgi:DNA repair protein RadC
MSRRDLVRWIRPARPGVAGRVRELCVTYRPHPAGIVTPAGAIDSAEKAAAILVPLLEREAVEVFLVLHLDAKARVLGVQEVARGGLHEIQVSIRPILAACLAEKNSASIVLAHNHPSGDPTPSPEDIALTRRIVAACELCGIGVSDHLIVGDGQLCSFVETGRLERL